MYAIRSYYVQNDDKEDETKHKRTDQIHDSACVLIVYPNLKIVFPVKIKDTLRG